MDTYEQKYKDALGMAEEIIRYYKEHNRGDETSIEDLEQIFPELKESGDERIRKALIKAISRTHKGNKLFGTDVTREEALAWLEKQGEKKSLTIDIKSMVDSYKQRLIKNGGVNNSPLVNMCVEAFQHGVENTLDELHLKQILANSCKTCKDEQKLFDYENANIQQKDFAPKADMPRYSIGDVLCDKSCTMLNKESQSNFEITDIRNGMYICDKCSFPISQQDEYELVAKRIEQKPDWSEEDECNMRRIIGVLEDNDSDWNELTAWLKSLKERIES